MLKNILTSLFLDAPVDQATAQREQVAPAPIRFQPPSQADIDRVLSDARKLRAQAIADLFRGRRAH